MLYIKGILHEGKLNYMKSALVYSDMINTVSETYAKEICNDPEFSFGLQKVLHKRSEDLYGIVNGIDISIWNPEKDKLIAKKYSIKKLEDKEENKKELLDKFGLDYKEGVPVIGIISRLYDAKGLDLIQKAFKDLMKMDLQIVLLGTGDKKYHKFFETVLMKNRDKYSHLLGFDDELAHLIEAGADMLLMPSRFEPCGLNQMYSLVYGTIPIVRATGGLADTVENFDPKAETGNGFVFEKYDAKEMLNTILKAIKIYNEDKKTWNKIQKAGMKSNFSWLNSSKNYVDLYKKLAN